MIAAIAALTVAVLGGAVAPARATWTTLGPGTGAARANQLQAPATASSTVTSAGTHLSWPAPTNGPLPGGYLVTREGSTICTTRETSCNDVNLIPGKTYSYLVRSTAGQYWVSATAATTTATTVAGGFTLSALSTSTVTSGVGVTFTVAATYGTGAVDPAYVDAHKLTITSSTPVSPNGRTSGGQVTPTFVAGVATKVATTLYAAGPQTLTVSDGVRTGSLTITVSPAAVFTMKLISDTTNAVVCTTNGRLAIAAGQQKSVRVALTDPDGNLAAATAATTVALVYTGSGTVSKASVTIPSGSTSSQSFALSVPTGTLKPGTLTMSVQGTSLLSHCYVN